MIGEHGDKNASRTGGNVLVLGGGGARGFAHFGALQVLEDAGVKIDRVVGVSIGAFVGALYCQQPDARAITSRVYDYVSSEAFTKYLNRMARASRRANIKDEEQEPIEPTDTNGGSWFGRLKDYFSATLAFHRVVTNRSILTNKPMEHCMQACLENTPIEDLQIPLTIVAADLKSGSRVRIEKGDLYTAVLGSSALPGIFPPVEREDALLADYGVACSIPVTTALRYRPEKIIAVDLTPQIEPKDEFSSGLEILHRMQDIGGYLFKEHISGYADVVIRPDVSQVDWSDFHMMDQVLEEGARAAESVLPTLLRVRRGDDTRSPSTP